MSNTTLLKVSLQTCQKFRLFYQLCGVSVQVMEALSVQLVLNPSSGLVIILVLDERWPLKRLPIVMRCILRLGTFELISKLEVPAGVVVKEYVDLAHSFFSGKEPGMVNGVLDCLAHQLRPGELEARLERREKSSK